MNFVYFDELQGLNGYLEKEFINLKCLLFTRENYNDVFEKSLIPEDAYIVYCLTSIRQIPASLHIDRFLVSYEQKFSRKFYIGQSTVGVSRISQHCRQKDPEEWWEIGVAFYSKTFDIDTIHSLEKMITEHAKNVLSADSLDCDPKNTFSGKKEIPDNIKELIFQVLDWFGIPKLSSTSHTSPLKTDQKETNQKETDKKDVFIDSNQKTEPKENKGSTMIFTNAQKTAWIELNCVTKSLVLKKGSIIANIKDIKSSFDRSPTKQKLKERAKLRTDSGNHLLQDLPVNSASYGAEIVTGCATNGKIYWKNKSNQTIGDVLSSL